MTQKLATDMSDEEYEIARAAAIRGSPGLSGAELADLESRRDDGPKDARALSDAEFEAAKAKFIRDSR
jgi:hypothetical protein